jgi:sporulation protein YlmC with PRC-barrel domain
VATRNPNPCPVGPLSVSRHLTGVVSGTNKGLGIVSATRRFVTRTRFTKGGTALSKFYMTAALAATLMATAPTAYAQVSTAPHTSAAATSAAGSEIQPDQFRATKMIGSSVYDVQNRDIGKVKDLVLDRDGRVAMVVVDVGSFLGVGGKYVGINISDIKTNNNRLTLDRTKEQLQQMTEYRLQDRNTGAGTSTSPTTGGRLGR